MFQLLSEESFALAFDPNDHAKKVSETKRNNMLDQGGLLRYYIKFINEHNNREKTNYGLIILKILECHFRYEIETEYYICENVKKRRHSHTKCITYFKEILNEMCDNQEKYIEILNVKINNKNVKIYAYKKEYEGIISYYFDIMIREKFIPYLKRQKLNEIANNILNTMFSKKYILE